VTEREPIRAVAVVVVVMVAGIALGFYAMLRHREDNGESAIVVAREFNLRGYRLEERVRQENPGATLEWSVVWTVVEGKDSGMVRVAVKAVRDQAAVEYRFDVDRAGGHVHPANPHARELFEQAPEPPR
jgi:hypothetical protein